MTNAPARSSLAHEGWFDVALGNPSEADHNTIVLSGIDLLVPLELDLDDDPLQDDEVRLQAIGGGFERILLSSDPQVQPDPAKRLLIYRFRAVPSGVYRLSVKVGERWTDLFVGLVVRKDGAYLGSKKLDARAPEAVTETPAQEPDAEAEAPAPTDELGEFMDVNDGHFYGYQ